jgi:hypothetical protein
MELHNNNRIFVILLLITALTFVPSVSAGIWAANYKNCDTNEVYEWNPDLATEQFAELLELKKQNPDITIVEAFTIVAPDQLVTMPEPMKQVFQNIPLYGDMDESHWLHDLINDVWYDPDGNVVPESDVPLEYRGGPPPSEQTGTVTQSDGNDAFTNSMLQRLVVTGTSGTVVQADSIASMVADRSATGIRDLAVSRTENLNALSGVRETSSMDAVGIGVSRSTAKDRAALLASIG